MDLKTESRIIVSALAIIPGAAGIFVVIGGEGVAYGWLLIILSLVILVWLWQPWKWFQKKDKPRHK